MPQDALLSQSPATPKGFAVHSDQLKAAARAISLSGRSSEMVVITLSTNTMQLCESTIDGGVSVTTTIDPLRPLDLAENETISFEIPKRILSSWGQHYNCELLFELDKDQDTLAWQGLGRVFQMKTLVRFIDPQDHVDEHRHVASVDSCALRDAIRHAATLIDKRTANLRAFDGLEISDGSAKSGYLRGTSLYKANDLPDKLRFILPKRNVANALSSISKMEGQVEVTETDHAVYIQCESTELRWTKAGKCPPLDRIFHNTTEATFNVMAIEALSSVLIASIGSDRGRIILEKTDREPTLSLMSIAPSAKYEVAFKGQCSTCNLEPGTKLAFNVSLADMCRVLSAIRTSTAEISIGKRFLLVKSSCETYEEFSLLAGFE